LKTLVAAILQVVGYLCAMLAVTIAVMGFTKMFVGDWEAGGPLLDLLGEGVLTILGIAITNLLLFLAASSSGVTDGWPALRVGLGGFAAGAMAGLVMAGSMLLLTLAFGGGRLLLDANAAGAYLPYVAQLGGILLVASLAEEWVFRGYPLTRLADGLGRGWGNLLMAILFAAAHYGSDGFNPVVMLNIALGSLVLGALRFTPGGIPTAWGFHFAWNFTQVLCGANLSLKEIEVPGITFASSGPPVLSGGEFGPEAGIVATIGTLVVLVLLTILFRRRGARDLPIPLRKSIQTPTVR